MDTDEARMGRVDFFGPGKSVLVCGYTSRADFAGPDAFLWSVEFRKKSDRQAGLWGLLLRSSSQNSLLVGLPDETRGAGCLDA